GRPTRHYGGGQKAEESHCGEAADFSSSDDERRQGFGVQEWPDGSKYEGEFVEGLKHGKGRYTSRNGEYYEGFFYKDFKHGDAVYCWPTGHTFTGKFYLNRKEGYGHFSFPGGAVFQINCHNEVIHRLLDIGANIDQLNREGMSALAVCHVLYYPFQSLHTTLIHPPTRAQVRKSRVHLIDNKIYSHNYDIAVTEGMLQHSAKALNRPQQCHLKETARKMAAMQIERHVRLDTLKLLLDRGADPNLCRVPMPVLFLATMAGDAEVIRKLLLCGACTDIPLPTEKGFYPLHAAAALPGSKGPEVTELLLHAITNPDAQACDQDEIYAPNLISMKDNEDQDSGLNLHLTEGGRTALHIACQRESDYLNACKVVALLLSHRARTDLLWSGHSPLSLAISSGNDLAVDELLKGGTDPNLPLGNRVGSALCTLTNFSYPLCGNRIKLLKKLAKAGANVSMPIRVGKWVGTAVDFAHYSVQQVGILPSYASGFVHIYNLSTSISQTCVCISDLRQPVLKFCCHCGLSASVKLTACRRCLKVFFCSVAWQEKTWVERHMKKCFKMSGGNQQIFSQQPKPRKT
uniref:Ankyrin repeat and MYND domain containing 1 n=1 Tax=Cyprinodon variegatus TaxID=28743 RepID=A0A3Q2E2D9_CYPVA